MPQTVYDVGDPITSRLKLGVTPDGTTNVSVVVYRPDGTTLANPTISEWTGTAGDEKTVQWFATNDGFSGSPTTSAAGDWLIVWTVTGKGASVTPKVYAVTRFRQPATRAEWVPLLSDVADHVPWLTVDTRTPGDQTYLGTFTGWTEPSDEQAQRHIDKAAALVGARLGTVPTTLHPLAARAAALEAAATLARAFPRNRSDIDTAASLAEAAGAALAEVRAAVDATETSDNVLTPQPVGYAPAPHWFGDLDL